MSHYKVTELWRYPVKSMAGERVNQVEVRPGGVVGDRRWALRDGRTGKIVSAKRPRPFGKLLNWSAALTESGDVQVTSPGGEDYTAGDPHLDEVLSTHLEHDVTMVRVVEGADETYDSEWPEIPDTTLSETEAEFPIAMMTEKVSFVDLGALHIVVAESLDHLAELSGADVGVERFRPNLVVAATESASGSSFVDLTWKEIGASVGDAQVWIADAAPRCVMTTLAQGRYAQAKPILAALAASARKESDFGTFACFGTYAEVTAPGTISVGDQFLLPE